jgi:predicted Mrr-cat superfamily restriction endonuclease
MSFWMVRGDKFGQYHSLALEKGFAYHASSVSDLSKTTSREAVLEILKETHPEGTRGRAKLNSGY